MRKKQRSVTVIISLLGQIFMIDPHGDGIVQYLDYINSNMLFVVLCYFIFFHYHSFPVGRYWMKDTWDLPVLFFTMAFLTIEYAIISKLKF